MEDLELQNIWKAYDAKLEEAKILNLQSWALNLQCFEALQKQKAKSELNRLARIKKWMVIVGLIWVFFLLFIVRYSLDPKKIFFVLSVAGIVIITTIAIVVYIRQVVLIKEIDNSESVIEVQNKMARLQMSTIRITRISFLQAPFYCTFIIRADQIHEWQFWVFTVPITLFFTGLSIWLYRNISYKNANKKWVKILLGSAEWTLILKAQKFMKEIEEFKQELTF